MKKNQRDKEKKVISWTEFPIWVKNWVLKSPTKGQRDQITKLEGVKMRFRSGGVESGSESKLKLFATKELWKKRITTQWKLKAFGNDEEERMLQKLEAIQKETMKESLECPFSPLLAEGYAPKLPPPPFSSPPHLMNPAYDWRAWEDDAFPLITFGVFSSDGLLWLLQRPFQF